MKLIKLKDDNQTFTIVRNALIRREDLSRAAKFLLIELMSHADGYDLSVRGLAACGSEGKHAVRKMVEELEEAGLLHRFQARKEGSQFGSNAWVFGWNAISREEARAVFEQRETASGDSHAGDQFSGVGELATKNKQEKEITKPPTTSARASERKEPLDVWLDRQVRTANRAAPDGELAIDIRPGSIPGVCSQVLSAMVDRGMIDPTKMARAYLIERVVEMVNREQPLKSSAVARFMTRDVWEWEPPTRAPQPRDQQLGGHVQNEWTEALQ